MSGHYLNSLFINLLDCGILPRLRLFFGDVSHTSSQVTFLTAGGDLCVSIWFSGDSNIFLLTVCKFSVQQHISTRNKICPKTSSVAHTQRGNKYQFDISIYKYFLYKTIKMISANPVPTKNNSSTMQQIFQM